jgi:AcrR family transcriptional regulator
VPDEATADSLAMQPQPPTASLRGSRTAARLRQAAREAFADLGWQATRVQDIVQRAGVSHGTFYTYYTNKAAVLDDLVRLSQADLTQLASRPWEGDDVRLALTEILGGLIELYERDAPILRSWLDAARDERRFSGLYLELRGLYIGRVAENLDRVIAMSGRDSAAPSRTIAAALVAMVEQLCYSWIVLGETHTHEEALDALVLIWGSTLNALAGFELVRS